MELKGWREGLTCADPLAPADLFTMNSLTVVYGNVSRIGRCFVVL